MVFRDGTPRKQKASIMRHNVDRDRRVVRQIGPGDTVGNGRGEELGSAGGRAIRDRANHSFRHGRLPINLRQMKNLQPAAI
jgi:hypothetical protein